MIRSLRLAMVGATLLFTATFYAAYDATPRAHAFEPRQLSEGQRIFRFDTFGDEQLWTNVLRLHEALPSVDPSG